VPGQLARDAILVHHAVDVNALALEADPAVETGTARIIEPHVPLPDERRLVPRFAELARPGEERVADDIEPELVVVDDVMGMRIQAGEKTRPAWRAQRSDGEEVSKPGSLTAHAIDVWRFRHRMPGQPEQVRALVVRDDEKDV